jgi:hypothetical protein
MMQSSHQIEGIEDHPDVFRCRDETDTRSFTPNKFKYVRELRVFIDPNTPGIPYPAFGTLPANPFLSLVMATGEPGDNDAIELLFAGVTEFDFQLRYPLSGSLSHLITMLPLLEIVDMSARQTTPTPWLIHDPESRQLEFRAAHVRVTSA